MPLPRRSARSGDPDPCAFVPPYLLRHVAAVDDAGPSACARRSLATDARLRVQRGDPALRHRSVLTETEAGAAGSTRVVHSADNTEQLPGRAVRTDGDSPSGDVTVDEAWDYSGQVLDLFAQQFGRDAIDGQGGTLSITVHYGQDYDNAFWNGSQLVFGDGDGVIFERFTKPPDVMAHEFTHGVTQFSAGLTYQGQSGALNESVSDAFAAMSTQWTAGQTAAEADWLIGAGLFLPSINAKALRSMTEPGTAYDDPRIGKDPQVGSMADYVETTEDSGGVHINSGIPNRAFALAAIALGGHSWERAGKIWYDTLTGGAVRSDTDFAGFARATVSSAGRLFSTDVTVAQKVRGAWAEVGVLPATDNAPADVAAGAPTGDPLTPTGIDTIAVRRSGGVAGISRAAELDLNEHPSGPEVRRLLAGTDLRRMATTAAGADRFVYTIEFGAVRLTLPEHDLGPDLDRVVRIVLDTGTPVDPRGRPDEPGSGGPPTA